MELHVLPSEDGSFLTRLGVVVIAVGAPFWVFIESDIGKAFLKGLTGQEPAYWAETVGKELRLGIMSAISRPQEKTKIDDDDRKLGETIVCEMTKSFLSSDNEKLNRIGINPRRFREAFVAKNDFYDTCIQTSNLRAVGFTEDPAFPITRYDFLQLHSALPPKEDEIVEHPWFFGITELKVTSPNWDRGDLARQWKGRDQQGRERFFRIEDEAFWLRAGTGNLKANVVDFIKVQWAYQGKPDHPVNCRVLKVLEFNGEKISDPVDEEILTLSYSKPPERKHIQGDLF